MTGLHFELNAVLTSLRGQRAFDAETYLDAKDILFDAYMRRSGLSSVVVGVSGGIDSAAVLGMLRRSSQRPGSPIKRIVAALLPYRDCDGTTNQEVATQRGREVALAFDAECVEIDLSSTHTTLHAICDAAMNVQSNAWASGQLVSYLRTPALFYLTSLLTQEGYPSLLVGTTNRDEGGYIGFFGKAADAMVDLQLISDAHKSEIFAISRILGVPHSALDAAPTGDIYDGRSDEQLIGVPYDFIELYQLYLCLRDQRQQAALVASLGDEARRQFDSFAARLRQLNRQNSHKYLGGSPAVHLDVYERAVPDGWRREFDPDKQSAAIDQRRFVNPVTMPAPVIDPIKSARPISASARTPLHRQPLLQFGSSAFVVDELLDPHECQSLLNALGDSDWTPVGRNGMLANFDPQTDVVGSWRASLFSEEFAHALFNRLAPLLAVRVMEEDTPTDWNGDAVWRAVGVNPLMRFIRYTDNGLLVPHYDAPYNYHSGKRTLMSLVVYLTDGTPGTGGETRFIADPQTRLPLKDRKYADWNREATTEEVLLEIVPRSGSSLVFDHRILHDSARITAGAHKVIMRTDVVFERCGLPDMQRVSASRPLGMPETYGRRS